MTSSPTQKQPCIYSVLVDDIYRPQSACVVTGHLSHTTVLISPSPTLLPDGTLEVIDIVHMVRLSYESCMREMEGNNALEPPVEA